MNLRMLTAVLPLTVAGAAHAGIVAHWSFDAAFDDDSGNLNDLSVGAGTPYITTAVGEHVFGSGALDLAKAEGEYLTPTSNFSFSTSDAWSVSFWARRRAGTAAATGMVVGDNTTNDSFIWVPDNSNVVQGLRFRPVGVGTAVNIDYATGHDGDFHHWAIVADGTGSIRAYRDGVDLGAQAVSGGTDFDIKAVGSGYTGTNQLFDGQLDELYVFDEAIDANAVSSLFTTNTVPEPGSLALIGLGGLLVARRRRA